MTTSEPLEVGAVQAAWDEVAVLRSDNGECPVLRERIAMARDLYGAHQLFQGTVFLLGGALAQISAERDDFTDRFTDVLLTKLSQWEDDGVLPADLPMVAQAVTVAFEGRDPFAWREQAGPVSASEPRAMTCALALIDDFIDGLDGPGVRERTLLTALSRSLD
ncbi:hypothetical protein ACFYVL_43005 [Streptomyces sp. NPDC004111]|uniref:hypothetical protein n=1 Tax=Streptomyces sp. NPDC004111 TaxID=3364690 RepID=UPI0036B15596